MIARPTGEIDVMSRIRTACLLACLLVPAGPVLAAEDGGCSAFKWPLAREQAWLTAPHPSASSGDSTPRPEGALTLKLQPADQVSFNPAPDRKPATGSFGATLAIGAVDKDGVYQVTLSDEAWVDVVQDGAKVKSSGFSGQKNCPGLRKSVRFKLKPGPAVLQISGAKAQQIDVAVGPAT
jgi:hypothetical protein